MKKINYYFDFLSPFSYFSWVRHSIVKKEFDCKTNVKETELNFSFQYRPVVMGTLFNHWGIKGPGEIAPKRHYMLKQCFKYAAKMNIPFAPPKQHPFNPLYALRLATISCAGEENQFKVIDALWKAVWADSIDLGEPENCIEVLNAIGLDGQKLLDKTFEREVKKELKNNTKEAITKNIFGVPTFAVEDEIFWGNDSLEDLFHYLKGEEVPWNKTLFADRSADIILDDQKEVLNPTSI